MICLFAAAVIVSPYLGIGICNILFSIYLILIAGRFFQKTKTGEAIRYHSLPSTPGEKLASAVIMLYAYWLVSVIIIFTGAFLGELLIEPLIYVNNGPIDIANYFEITINQISTHSLLIAVFLFGSSYFKKNAVISTFLSIIIVCIIFSIFIGTGGGWMLHGFASTMNSGNLHLTLGELSVLSKFEGLIEWIIYAITLLFFYTLTYFKLRETEV